MVLKTLAEIAELLNVNIREDIYSFQTGATPPSKTESFYDGDNLWANIGDIDGKTIFETSKRLSDEGVNVCSMNMSPKGSLLYSFKLSVGQVAFCGVDMYTNEAIATFIGEPTALSNLYYVAPLFIVFNANTNNYGAPILNQDLIKNAIIPVPPEIEQERIAVYLDEKCGEIDELIDVEQEMISDLESYRQEVITEAVTHGLNPNVPTKPTGINWKGNIPEHWKKTKVKFYITISSGESFTKEKIITDGKFPVYGGGEMIGYYDQSNISKGTIVIGRVGARRGCVTIIEDDTWATDNALILNTNQNVKYFGFLLRGANLNQLNESNVQPLITATKVKELSITLPPLSEQEEIAEYLDKKCSEIDELIKVKQEKIETLKQYRQSLIFEAITGKTTIV